jgi:hypothetical protein
MSSIARWSYTQPMTVWRKLPQDGDWPSEDFSAPELILCGYQAGGTDSYVDSTGMAFTPKELFYTELADSDQNYITKLNFGDKVVLGDQSLTSQPTKDAQVIKAITEWDANMFDGDTPDFLYGV